MSELDELLDDIFDGTNRTLREDFARWVRRTRRFRTFAATYRTKIRAKLKNVRGPAGMEDLRAELETAALLLVEPRFTLEYEKFAATKQRGPDFTVTYKTHTPFNVEVRHVRKGDLDESNVEARVAKLVGVLCDKVAQMPPGTVNLLWLVPEGRILPEELDASTTVLRQLAEQKVETFFQRCGYRHAGEFLKQYGRLSAIVVRETGTNTIWLNPLARHRVSPEIATALRRLESGSLAG